MTRVAKTVSILGVSGSIGGSTVAVIEEFRAQGQDIAVEAVTAGANIGALVEACRLLRPRFAAVADAALLESARSALKGLDVEVGAGPGAIEEAAARPAEWVMSAIMGAAGLSPTMAAIRRGAAVALANKECLICAGPVVLAAAQKSGAQLLPVDSEHSAIFQVLSQPERVERLTLTASGGPFRTWTREAMARAAPAQACAHPNWSMGAKISVDSATLMNKGLELIEAAYLFAMPEDQIDILIHPQSIVHSLVHYCDGSVLAQLSAPDMRGPIAYALTWPDRAPLSAKRLDLAGLGQLTFDAPDLARFPALGLARSALRHGAGAAAALSAANEVAVGAFLAGELGFLDIASVVEQVLAELDREEAGLIAKTPTSLDDVAQIDGAARRRAQLAARRLSAA